MELKLCMGAGDVMLRLNYRETKIWEKKRPGKNNKRSLQGKKKMKNAMRTVARISIIMLGVLFMVISPASQALAADEAYCGEYNGVSLTVARPVSDTMNSEVLNIDGELSIGCGICGTFLNTVGDFGVKLSQGWGCENEGERILLRGKECVEEGICN